METLLFPFADYWPLYLGFVAFVGLMLGLDLGVFHRKAHPVSFKEAAGWSAFWVTLSLVFNFVFYRYAHFRLSNDPQLASVAGFDASAEAGRLGLEFLTGFLVEKALAIDNIFVFVLVFSAFRIPALYQHRVLFFGIIGALVFRAAFIALGAQLMAYHWIVVAFGVFLALTGLKMFFSKGHSKQDPSQSTIIRAAKRLMPVTQQLHGQKLFVKVNGVRHMTPLFIALIFIEMSDIVFAVDSVPAIFSITREPLIVFMSNILAMLGLRSLYFMLAGVIDRFVFLKHGLAAVLVFVGLKMAWLDQAFGGKLPIGVSLGIIGALILGSIVLSILVTKKDGEDSELPLGAQPAGRIIRNGVGKGA